MMSTGIGTVCVRDVTVVTRDITVTKAAQSMRQQHVGALVVVDVSAGMRLPVGILTDRDIVVEVVAAGLMPETVTVSEVMQHSAVVVREYASCAEAVRLMARNGVRRLPVVDERGNLTGLIAVDDLLPYLAQPLSVLAALPRQERENEGNTRR